MKKSTIITISIATAVYFSAVLTVFDGNSWRQKEGHADQSALTVQSTAPVSGLVQGPPTKDEVDARKKADEMYKKAAEAAHAQESLLSEFFDRHAWTYYGGGGLQIFTQNVNSQAPVIESNGYFSDTPHPIGLPVSPMVEIGGGRVLGMQTADYGVIGLEADFVDLTTLPQVAPMATYRYYVPVGPTFFEGTLPYIQIGAGVIMPLTSWSGSGTTTCPASACGTAMPVNYNETTSPNVGGAFKLSLGDDMPINNGNNSIFEQISYLYTMQTATSYGSGTIGTTGQSVSGGTTKGFNSSSVMIEVGYRFW